MGILDEIVILGSKVESSQSIVHTIKGHSWLLNTDMLVLNDLGAIIIRLSMMMEKRKKACFVDNPAVVHWEKLVAVASRFLKYQT
jgi:hypothetical protein